MLKNLLITAAISVASTASATTLFFDDFESGLGQWSTAPGGVTPGFGGTIVSDPLESDNALTFNQLDGAIDIWTDVISNPTGNYILSFDYLGTCTNGNCGGFIWNSITGWNGTTTPYPDTLPDTGSWESVTLSFSGATSIRLGLEDWIGSYGTYGDAFFDNIELTDEFGSSRPVSVSESGSLALLGLGLVGLGLVR